MLIILEKQYLLNDFFLTKNSSNSSFFTTFINYFYVECSKQLKSLQKYDPYLFFCC